MAKYIIFFVVFVFKGSVAYALGGKTSFMDTNPLIGALASLALVILIIYLSLRFLKYLNRLTLNRSNSDNIRLIESFSLSQTARIHIIKVVGSIYCIMENQGAIEVISEIDEEDLELNSVSVDSFKNLLNLKINKIKNNSDEDEA